MPDKIHSVSEINRNIRFVLEGKFRGIWIEGEVSNHRKPTSGHHYFTLKDAGGQISCVMFRTTAQQIQTDLKDGLKVQILGDVSVYEQRGQYQIIVQDAKSTGHGELQARFEALKKKLNDEGLFAPEHKKPIPRFPRTIALVTSPTGAAIQDILKVMARRAPWIRLVVAPVKVQGEGAFGEIARAIQFLSSRPDSIPQIDTMIVGRGGGSIEDLWAFNEEAVARAIFECPIPVISGVGHEIDFTISDFVADRREPTPSAAAEAAVPDGEALHHRLETVINRMDTKTDSTFRERLSMITSLRRELDAREPARVLENRAQSIDYLEERLDTLLDRRIETEKSRLEYLQTRLKGRDPEIGVMQLRENLSRRLEELESALERQFRNRQDRLESTYKLCKAIGPDKTLRRGFSITMDESGQPIFHRSDLEPGQVIVTRFSDGEAMSRVEPDQD